MAQYRDGPLRAAKIKRLVDEAVAAYGRPLNSERVHSRIRSKFHQEADGRIPDRFLTRSEAVRALRLLVKSDVSLLVNEEDREALRARIESEDPMVRLRKANTENPPKSPAITVNVEPVPGESPRDSLIRANRAIAEKRKFHG